MATQPIERPPQEFAARRYRDIRYWTELGRGGHFIAGEEPMLLAEKYAFVLSIVALGKTAEQPLALDRLRPGDARALRQPMLWLLGGVLPESAASEAER